MEANKDSRGKRSKKKNLESQVHYYIPSDVIKHNRADDIWVSFLGKVLDITPLVKEFHGKKEVKPLLSNAGKDISNWFDKTTQDIKTIIHPITGLRVPYCPFGPIPHVQPPVPMTSWQPVEMLQRPYIEVPWWRDKRYFKGLLSKNPRPLKIINGLLVHESRHNLVWVASEETLLEIFNRLRPFNSGVERYKFKFEGTELNLNKTLEENEVLDERKTFNQLGLPDNTHIPAIHLYFKDEYD